VGEGARKVGAIRKERGVMKRTFARKKELEKKNKAPAGGGRRRSTISPRKKGEKRNPLLATGTTEVEKKASIPRGGLVLPFAQKGTKAECLHLRLMRKERAKGGLSSKEGTAFAAHHTGNGGIRPCRTREEKTKIAPLRKKKRRGPFGKKKRKDVKGYGRWCWRG